MHFYSERVHHTGHEKLRYTSAIPFTLTCCSPHREDLFLAFTDQFEVSSLSAVLLFTTFSLIQLLFSYNSSSHTTPLLVASSTSIFCKYSSFREDLLIAQHKTTVRLKELSQVIGPSTSPRSSPLKFRSLSDVSVAPQVRPQHRGDHLTVADYQVLARRSLCYHRAW